MFALGIDLGGTLLRGAIVDKEGNIIHERKRPTEANKGPEYVIQKMKQMICELLDLAPVIGIGIGSPGPLHNGVIHQPPNLPNWDSIPLVDMIQQDFQLPIYLDNDANVAALAEACFGAGRDVESIFYITVSTGIGGGYVADKQVIKGAMNCTGEIGNMIIATGGPTMQGLNKGSLESLASGTALGHFAKERLSILGGAKELFYLAHQGNETANIIVQENIQYLATGIANIIHIINPHKIVLGGGVMQSYSDYLVVLKSKIDSLLFTQLRETTEISLAMLGQKTGVVGAALLTGIFNL